MVVPVTSVPRALAGDHALTDWSHAGLIKSSWLRREVESFEPGGTIPLAGIMARTGLTATDANVFSYTTQSSSVNTSGWGFSYRSVSAGTTTNSASGYLDYPELYLRLTRSGNVFTSYVSVDGATWIQTGQVTLSLSSTLYIGLAVTSNDNSQLSDAVFRNFG